MSSKFLFLSEFGSYAQEQQCCILGLRHVEFGRGSASDRRGWFTSRQSSISIKHKQIEIA